MSETQQNTEPSGIEERTIYVVNLRRRRLWTPDYETAFQTAVGTTTEQVRAECPEGSHEDYDEEERITAMGPTDNQQE